MHRLVFFLLISSAAAEPLTLTPARDSDVYSFTVAPTSSVHTLGVTASGEGSPHSQRSLVQFDLTGADVTTGRVESAMLRLYVLAPDPNFGTLGAGKVSVHPQEAAWTVSSPTLRWNHIRPLERIGLIVIGAEAADTWVDLDVTATVSAWLGGSMPNHGFVLQPETESPATLNVTFASMELANAGVAPQLVVVTAADSAPGLTIGSEDGRIFVEWPAPASEAWRLQWATADLQWQDWDEAHAPIATVDGRRKLYPDLPHPACFFRLAR